MSEAIGETFVTITPILNKGDIKEQVKAFQGDLQGALAATQQAQERSEAVGLKALVGQATVEEATAARLAYAQAGKVAATVDVEQFIATGKWTSTLQSSINLLQQETVATEQNTVATRQNAQVRRTSLREQGRQILSGQAPLSGLGGLGGIAKLGAGALAFGAVIQGVQHLTKALKVTGDEAFTTEGKFRNFGAELLSGDLVGGFLALNANAKSTSEQFKDLRKEAGTTSVDLRNFGNDASKSATQLEKVAEAQRRVGGGGAFAKAVAEAAKETRKAADDALALGRAYDTAAIAVQGVTDAIAAAGSEAAMYGERTRGLPQLRGVSGADQGGTVDSTATDATSNAEAQSRAARTKSLQDDLVQLKVEAQQAATLEKNQQDIVEGRAARHQTTVDARTKVILKQQQIDAEAAAERKRAAAEATTAVKQAAADAKTAAGERAAALRAGLAFREDTLQGALADAQSGSLADQRKALQALIVFNLAESRNRGLDKSERLKALLDARQYQRDLNALNRESLAAAMGVREQNLRNAIEAAKLTDGEGDDKRANARYLKFLKAQVERAKKLKDGGAALAAARGDLIAFKLTLKALKEDGAGFSLADLFAKAGEIQREFGGFSESRNGIRSPQDAQAFVADRILANGIAPGNTVSKSQLALANEALAEARRQTAYLQTLVGNTSGKGVEAATKTTPRPKSVPIPQYSDRRV